MFESFLTSLWQWTKRLFFHNVMSYSILAPGNGIYVQMVHWSPASKNMCKSFIRAEIFLVGMLISSRKRLVAHLRRKKGTVWFWLNLWFAGVFADSNFSKVALWYTTKLVVKIVVYICSVPKGFGNFFVDWKQFGKTVNLLFDKHWLFLIPQPFQVRISGIVVKAYWTASVSSETCFVWFCHLWNLVETLWLQKGKFKKISFAKKLKLWYGT